MFRVQNNIPEIYIDKSRDFQILARANDAVFGNCKYLVDSIRHTANTAEINASLLPLLKSKLGMFIDKDLGDYQLRTILSGFPHVLRNKGTKKALIDCVNLWLRSSNIQGKIITSSIDNKSYSIKIYIEANLSSTALLDELMTFIVPSAYTVEYIGVDDIKTIESDFYFTTHGVIFEAAGQEINNVYNNEESLGYRVGISQVHAESQGGES